MLETKPKWLHCADKELGSTANAALPLSHNPHFMEALLDMVMTSSKSYILLDGDRMCKLVENPLDQRVPSLSRRGPSLGTSVPRLLTEVARASRNGKSFTITLRRSNEREIASNLRHESELLAIANHIRVRAFWKLIWSKCRKRLAVRNDTDSNAGASLLQHQPVSATLLGAGRLVNSHYIRLGEIAATDHSQVHSTLPFVCAKELTLPNVRVQFEYLWRVGVCHENSAESWTTRVTNRFIVKTAVRHILHDMSSSKIVDEFGNAFRS
ncbi:hypothetical protein F5I97DRAFT_1833097 [Phlebopus sp. FC_14]|nr:hypothetical protein F5I97DRAFT_1833097 [Phlebopus sp. FC_14]